MTANKEGISAGSLRNRVTLQKPVRIADGGGGFTRSWEDVATLWADIIPSRSKASVAADKILMVSNYTIKMRYCVDVSIEKRFVCNGRIFVIEGISSDHDTKTMMHIFVRQEN